MRRPGLDAEAELDAEEERELQDEADGRGGRPLSYCSSWEVGGFRDSSMWVCDACVYQVQSRNGGQVGRFLWSYNDTNSQSNIPVR